MVGEMVRVTEVIDGDTFKADPTQGRDPFNLEGSIFTVRLLGYDASERGQPRYEEAKEELERLIGGKDVSIVHEYNRDVYDRLLAHVCVSLDNNEDLVNVTDAMKEFLAKLKAS